MTVKIVNFRDVNMTMVINRLTEYTTQHLSGMDDIPHLCVKVRHGNGFAWFGLSIIAPQPQSDRPSMWTSSTVRSVKEQFLQAMAQVIDMTEMDSDVDLLLRSIQDICNMRKRPVMFGGGSNEFIQIGSKNNIQIELYRTEVKPASATYGGYFMLVEYGDHTFPVMMYHRGIILYNYITKEAALELLHEELLNKFPEFFDRVELLTIPYKEITQVPRNRNQWAKVK